MIKWIAEFFKLAVSALFSFEGANTSDGMYLPPAQGSSERLKSTVNFIRKLILVCVKIFVIALIIGGFVYVAIEAIKGIK